MFFWPKSLLRRQDLLRIIMLPHSLLNLYQHRRATSYISTLCQMAFKTSFNLSFVRTLIRFNHYFCRILIYKQQKLIKFLLKKTWKMNWKTSSCWLIFHSSCYFYTCWFFKIKLGVCIQLRNHNLYRFYMWYVAIGKFIALVFTWNRFYNNDKKSGVYFFPSWNQESIGGVQ